MNMQKRLSFRGIVAASAVTASLALVACDFGSDAKSGTKQDEKSLSETIDATDEDLDPKDEKSRNSTEADSLLPRDVVEEPEKDLPQVTEPSSSSETPMSSQVLAEENFYDGMPSALAVRCFETWNGIAGDYFVQAGLNNGSVALGYWFSYGDNFDGGSSAIEWPVAIGNVYSEESLDPVIDHCGGLCGKYNLKKGSLTYDPYVGLGFYLNESSLPIDASSMGGVVVTYTSDADILLEMSLGAENDEKIDFDNPYVKLPKSADKMVKLVYWNQFKQMGWSNKKITGEDAAKILVSLRFKIQGRNGLAGSFNIMKVEAYHPGECPTVVPPKSSSSSEGSVTSSSSEAPRSSSSGDSEAISPESDFETWVGDLGEYRIMTGFNTEREDGGYWFSYDDSPDKGESQIDWPEPLGNEYDLYAFDPVIENCRGICGTYKLNAGVMEYNPFVGVGFNMAGTDENENLVLADASDMGGVCVAYSSDTPIVLEMSLGEEKDRELEYDVPYVRLLASEGTVKDIAWKDFKRAGWGRGPNVSGEDAAKTLASLKFKIQGKDGSTGKFNIQSIGAYNGGCRLVVNATPL